MTTHPLITKWLQAFADKYSDGAYCVGIQDGFYYAWLGTSSNQVSKRAKGNTSDEALLNLLLNLYAEERAE